MVFGFYILASDFFLGLTPTQRWGAARGFSSNSMAERWFILIGIIAIITLTILFFVLSFKRTKQERKTTAQLFAEHAEKKGLSTRERQIVFDIANKARLKRNESVFTLATAFDRGAAEMKESLAGSQTTEENRQLRAKLPFLREKLGFGKRPVALTGQSTKPQKLSSRQIPTNKELYIRQQKDSDSEQIKSTVIANNDRELTVELPKPVKITFGQFWCARYYFGSSVREFDTSVVSYDGNILVLNHSDNVRLVNRRRFLRVPVRKQAFIVRFPFSINLAANGRKDMKSFKMYRSSASDSNSSWRPPEFVPAVVTELGGIGLRIEAPLDVKRGDRVLVMFRLDDEDAQDSNPVCRIVEDIGEVKNVRAIGKSLSIGVELIGLSDSNIDELIRATNAALLSVSGRNKNVPTSGDASESVPEHAGV